MVYNNGLTSICRSGSGGRGARWSTRSASPGARHTPGEIRRRAASSGLPEAALDVLLAAFRDVEYGARDPESCLEPVTSAERRVREAVPESTDAGGGAP